MSILKDLSGGDKRSIGNSNRIVSEVIKNHKLFKEVFDCMLSEDPIVRLRSADAVEKITALHPDWLHPFKQKLIYEISKIEQKEIQWHVAQMLPRLNLTETEYRDVVKILITYTELGHSSIVRTFAMQALVDIAKEKADLGGRVFQLVEGLVKSGTPAMKSRGRKLLAEMGVQGR